MVDGNAKSYARWLNSPERMKKYTDYNKLQSLIAGMKSEKDEEKKRKKEKKAADEAAKERKKIATKLKENKERERLMPSLIEELRKGVDSVQKLTNPKLKNILQHYFDVKNVKGLKRSALQRKIRECMEWMEMPIDDNTNPTDNETINK